MTQSAALHTVSIDNSDGAKPPVLFLHGFGGLAKQWWGLQTAVSYKAPTLSFDLPGFGDSIDFPKAGPPIVAARAIVSQMDDRKIPKFHLVGHSMGGAVASLIALIAPQRVASLTLLAPGGYGTQLNDDAIKQWAAVKERDEVQTMLPSFFGEGFTIPDKMVDFQTEARSRVGAVEKMTAIAEVLFDGGVQGQLPIADVLAGDYPISMVWGTDDKILPVADAQALEGKLDLHIVEGMGHSPAEENPELVKRIIFSRIAAS